MPTQSLLQEELALFNAALAANDFAIAVPGQPDFGQPCDPNSAEFDPGAGARPEACQVNLTAYAISPENSSFVGGRITRRADVTRDLQIISSGALNTGKVETDGLDFNFTYNYHLNFRNSEVTLTFGVIDLLDKKLPRLKNMNGTDLSVFDT